MLNKQEILKDFAKRGRRIAQDDGRHPRRQVTGKAFPQGNDLTSCKGFY